MQHGVIENEYVKSVSAHSTYFHNTDIVDFVMDVAGQSNPEVIDITSDKTQHEFTLFARLSAYMSDSSIEMEHPDYLRR